MASGSAATAAAAIRLRAVAKRFGSAAIIDGLDLDVDGGERVALLGASGCGKTTLLRMLAGLEQPSAGSAEIFGATPAMACSTHQIGMAFQRSALVPSRTALENVELTQLVTGRSGTLTPAELLARFGLPGALHRYPHQLSGGMQQRVNIACAMVHEPRLLLLDEPFGALDEITREDILEWLMGILEASRQTAVLVTHSVEEAVTFADRIVIMAGRPGRIAAVVPVPLPGPRDRAQRLGAGHLELVRQVKAALYAAMESHREAL